MNYQLYHPVKDKIHIIFGYFGSFFNSLSGNSLFIVIICYIDDFFKKKTTDDYKFSMKFVSKTCLALFSKEKLNKITNL